MHVRWRHEVVVISLQVGDCCMWSLISFEESVSMLNLGSKVFCATLSGQSCQGVLRGAIDSFFRPP